MINKLICLFYLMGFIIFLVLFCMLILPENFSLYSGFRLQQCFQSSKKLWDRVCLYKINDVVWEYYDWTNKAGAIQRFIQDFWGLLTVLIIVGYGAYDIEICSLYVLVSLRMAIKFPTYIVIFVLTVIL